MTAALREAYERVQSNGTFILGPEVAAFEGACAQMLGVPHAVGVSSGSDALLLALRALRIGPADEVITTPFTFAATAEAIVRAGATPVFADIDPETLCLSANSVEAMLTPRTRAVLFVHLYGNPCGIEEVAELCRRKGLPLVEDACQAFGATVAGRAAGGFGDVGCFSFFPTKPLGALGDGGLCVTADPSLAKTLSSLRQHGMDSEATVVRMGGNYRLDALQAAFLLEKLTSVERWRFERDRNASRYAEALAGCPRISFKLPERDSVRHAWALTTIRVPEGREQLRAYLARRRIETRVYYPKVLSAHDFFGHYPRAELRQAERASHEVLSIPNHFGLSDASHHRVVASLLAWGESAA